MKFRSLHPIFLALLICIFCLSSVSAEMTIYLKDGREIAVNKVVFENRKLAKLYLLDGRIVTTSVVNIDLNASGIGEPVGTYGEKRVSQKGLRGFARPAPVIKDSTIRQTALKEQWENADKTAVALRDRRNIRAGEKVKIVREPVKQDTSSKRLYYSYKKPRATDQVYLIVYKKPNGTYGKDMVDAASFSTYFRIEDPKVELPERFQQRSLPAIAAESSDVPEQKAAEEEIVISNESPGEVSTKEYGSASGKLTKKESFEEADVSSGTAPKKEKGFLPGLMIIAILALLGGLLAHLLLKYRQKPIISSSNFSQYEEELREFEIEIWLKNGKTIEQLREICLKKFYQDNQVAIGIGMKMLKGIQKNSVIPYIMKQSGQEMSEVESIYHHFEERFRVIDGLIEEVSERTGLVPQHPTAPHIGASPTTDPTKKIAEKPFVSPTSARPQPLGSEKEAAVVPAVSIPKKDAVAVARPAHVAPSKPLPIASKQARKSSTVKKGTKARSSSLPSYTANLIKQLGLLSEH